MSIRVLLAAIVATLPVFAAPVPKAAPKEGLIACRAFDKTGVRVLVIKPDGTEVARLDGFEAEASNLLPRLSQDGKRVAILVNFSSLNNPARNGSTEIRVYDVAKPEKPVAADLRPLSCVWGDANTLYVVHREGAGGKTVSRVSRINMTTEKAEVLDALDQHILFDVSDDGKALLVNRIGEVGGSYLVDAATLKMKRTTEEQVSLTRFSPDGKKAVGIQLGDPKGKVQRAPVVVDLATGTLSPLKVEEGNTYEYIQWHADGTKLLAWQRDPKGQREWVSCDTDGSNPKPFLKGKSSGMSGFDWR